MATSPTVAATSSSSSSSSSSGADVGGSNVGKTKDDREWRITRGEGGESMRKRGVKRGEGKRVGRNIIYRNKRFHLKGFAFEFW